MDLLGTVAFAVSGALVAIRRRMDIFGVVVLAIVTATGGGMLRDIIIGSLPPTSFLDPRYVGISALIGVSVFLLLYFRPHIPQKLSSLNNRLMFLFDTLGIAAFTVDGVAIGLANGFRSNLFLLVFLGSITGVGGGVIRDILANEMPDILRKHVYALTAILGGSVYALLAQTALPEEVGMIAGFATVVILRLLGARFLWNLPKIGDREKEGSLT